MTNARVDDAARKFFALIAPQERWEFTGHKAKPLALAAFKLYACAWGKTYDIRNWEWPFLALSGQSVLSGDEPWTILLRRAIELRD